MRMICSTKNSVLSAEPKQVYVHLALSALFGTEWYHKYKAFNTVAPAGVVHYTKVSVGSRLGARDRFATWMDYDQILTPFRALVYG